MVEDWSQVFRSPSDEGISAEEALRRPISSLLGVPEASVGVWAALGVRVVFDLAASWVIANARQVMSAAASARWGERIVLPGDILRNPPVDYSEDLDLLSIDELVGLTQVGKKLAGSLGISTIRELAVWAPALNAAAVMLAATGGSPETEYGDRLRPELGKFPSEQVSYDSLVMFDQGEASTSTPFNAPLRVDSATMDATPAAIGVGALLSYKQIWTTVGLGLGQLLHSLALAPGEATRIAVVDWSRRTSAAVSDLVAESDSLKAGTTQQRAIAEVQNATARDVQSGGSTAFSAGYSQSEAEAGTVSSGFLTSLFASGSYSNSSQSASSVSTGASLSWSSGSREVLGSMSQSINDRTQQHASSARSRRATSVREVSQTEQESISTRIVANYNHMHALTVQYFEVVQAYRVVTRLVEAVRVLYVPVEPIVFTADLVSRFRSRLVAAALDPDVARNLADSRPMVSIDPVVNDLRRTLLDPAGIRRQTIASSSLMSASITKAVELLGEGKPELATKALTDAPGPEQRTIAMQSLDETRRSLRLASSIVGRFAVSADLSRQELPAESLLVGIRLEGTTALSQARIDLVHDQDELVDVSRGDWSVLDSDMPLGVIRSIALIASDDFRVAMTLVLSYQGQRFETVPIVVSGTAGTQTVLRVAALPGAASSELLAHLNGNRSHYSSAALRGMTSDELVGLLGNFSWDGRLLRHVVEPTVYGIAGPYLVMRAPIDVDEASGVSNAEGSLTWRELLGTRGLSVSAGGGVTSHHDEQLVALPTSGVFAEAVLGASNSAEKLDITRFWNWQDSPIPLLPPEIAPVNSGSRSTTENLATGELSSPLIAMQAPAALPDPAGLSAALNTLASGSMFRDMSGLAGSQDLAKGASAGTLSAATEAGKLASTNLKTEAEKAVSMARIAADVAKAVLAPVPTSSDSAPKGKASVSEQGAQINHGKDMDDRGIPVGGKSSPTPSTKGSNPAAKRPTSSTPTVSQRSHEARAADPAIKATETAADLAPQTIPITIEIPDYDRLAMRLRSTILAGSAVTVSGNIPSSAGLSAAARTGRFVLPGLVAGGSDTGAGPWFSFLIDCESATFSGIEHDGNFTPRDKIAWSNLQQRTSIENLEGTPASVQIEENGLWTTVKVRLLGRLNAEFKWSWPDANLGGSVSALGVLKGIVELT